MGTAFFTFYFVTVVADSRPSQGIGVLCEDVTLPSTLYSSLVAILIVHVLVAVNEEMILLVSVRGTVWNDRPRRRLSKLLYLRAVLFVVDIGVLTFTTWAIFNNGTVAQLEPCRPFYNALRYTQAIVVVIWITCLAHAVGFVIFLDPLGCFSTSLLVQLRLLSTASREGEPHSGAIDRRRWFRRLQRIRWLFCIRDSAETTVAFNDLAHTLLVYFENVNVVPSDLLVGFLILHHDQKRKIQRDGVAQLITPLREVNYKLIRLYRIFRA